MSYFPYQVNLKLFELLRVYVGDLYTVSHFKICIKF